MGPLSHSSPPISIPRLASGVLGHGFPGPGWSTPWDFYGATCEADEAVVKSADVKGDSLHHYNKNNILYTAASVEHVKAAFARPRALSLTMDELSLMDTSVLQIFAASPATTDVASGWCCPPQLLPELNIDLQSKKIALRIAEAVPAGPAAKPARKPGGNELVCTWHVCQGIENAVKNLLPSDGLQAFMPPQPRPAPLSGPGRYARRRDGRWMRKLKDGK